MKHEMANGYVIKFAIWFNPKVDMHIGMVLVEELDETAKPSGVERGFIGNAPELDENKDMLYIVKNGASLLPEAIYAAQGGRMPLKKRRATDAEAEGTATTVVKLITEKATEEAR